MQVQAQSTADAVRRRQLLPQVLVTVLVGISLVAIPSLPAAAAPGAVSPDRQLLLRADGAQVDAIAQRHGLTVVSVVGPPADRLALVTVPTGQTLADLEAALVEDPDVRAVDRQERVFLPALSAADQAGATSPGSTLTSVGTATTPCLAREVANEAWSGFVLQAAADLIDLAQAHAVSPDCGEATVAILDTGVDPDHELLRDSLILGYDFLEDVLGIPSEWIQPDHSVQAILEETYRAQAQHSVQAILEGRGEIVELQASLGPIQDPEVSLLGEGIDLSALPPYFGHGTMVAGIVHLVAPAAKIMPLRVFDSYGEARLFDIIRAIYFAVDNGADVVNMSFSMEAQSQELLHAVHYARSRGVVCVAAAGNQGEQDRVFPAAFSPVLGVASTTQEDLLSPFSNFGSGRVAMAAPGSGVVSIYPGGLFAIGWGTSFSAPFASGTAALLHRVLPAGTTSASQVRTRALRQGSDWLPHLAGQIGSGRLNVLGTLAAASAD